MRTLIVEFQINCSVTCIEYNMYNIPGSRIFQNVHYQSTRNFVVGHRTYIMSGSLMVQWMEFVNEAVTLLEVAKSYSLHCSIIYNYPLYRQYHHRHHHQYTLCSFCKLCDIANITSVCHSKMPGNLILVITFCDMSIYEYVP